ncbi:hypothetical protein JCM11491_002872 [Sporobolomyces phaffii]
MLSGSTGLFAGMLAFHSPLIPPATRAIWCHHGGRIATEDDTARISVFFGANDRPDDLADRSTSRFSGARTLRGFGAAEEIFS